MIHCPICQAVVADVTASGRSEGVCPKCRYRYGAIYGRVGQSYTKQISHYPSPTGGTRLACELRIDRPDGGRALVEFEIPAGEDQFNVREGDSVTVVFIMKGAAFEAVVSVTNNTTRTSFDIARPGGIDRGDRSHRGTGDIFFTVACINDISDDCRRGVDSAP